MMHLKLMLSVSVDLPFCGKICLPACVGQASLLTESSLGCAVYCQWVSTAIRDVLRNHDGPEVPSGQRYGFSQPEGT